MRNMSFSLTTAQMRDRTKTVTRRLGWKNLKPGDKVMAVVKGMGLKKGEKVECIHPIRIISVTREPLCTMKHNDIYGRQDVVKEGFPEYSPAQFVAMFCMHNGCLSTSLVTRIEFEHL